MLDGFDILPVEEYYARQFIVGFTDTHEQSAPEEQKELENIRCGVSGEHGVGY